MNKLRAAVVFGTRPDAIKMAPLIRKMQADPKIEPMVCSTGQHREMLDQVLEIFDIKPDFDLNIMQENQSLQHITMRALEGLCSVFCELTPDVVLVHGDTTTCFAASLAAFYMKTAVGHVEAGLRTLDKYYPYPEEMNRRLAGTLADYHFAPTRSNKSNLVNEGVNPDRIYITGNTVIDAMSITVKNKYVFQNEVLRNLDFSSNKRYILVTAHRRENIGEPLMSICRAFTRITRIFDDVEIIYPVHMNPSVRNTVRDILGGAPQIHLIDPVNVFDLHNLINKSYFVMTDSGGMQEEAPALGKPVLVLRNETERPEAVAAGTVRLAGTDEEKVFRAASQLLSDKAEFERMARSVNPYGDGHASERIIGTLLHEFGLNAEKPLYFNS